MNIGDKVRLLHGNEEGVITKISTGGRIEIEIEDGFRIPAMKNEVVIISASERQYFGDGVKEEKTTTFSPGSSTSDQKEGVFLAYLPINDKDHSIYIVNSSERNYLMMVSEVYGDNSQTLVAGELPSKGSKKIGEKSISDFEDWPPLLCQFFPIHKKIEKTQASFERRIKFKYKNLDNYISQARFGFDNKLWTIEDWGQKLRIELLDTETLTSEYSIIDKPFVSKKAVLMTAFFISSPKGRHQLKL